MREVYIGAVFALLFRIPKDVYVRTGATHGMEHDLAIAIMFCVKKKFMLGKK